MTKISMIMDNPYGCCCDQQTSMLLSARSEPPVSSTQIGDLPRTAFEITEMARATRKTKNRIWATEVAVPATAVNPKKPATKASTRKTNA